MSTGKSEPKRVWILGAGFSRSLGGPLMFDLLSLEARRRILTTYTHQIDEPERDLIFWLFHFGAGFPEGPLDRELNSKGMKRWRDAEEFLETLDNARNDEAKKRVVTDVWVQLREATSQNPSVRQRYPYVFEVQQLPDMAQLARFARRMIAASCCSFVEGIDEKAARGKERWLPYQQWLGLLREGDSILTFNYDRVVELLEPFVGPKRREHAAWGVQVHGVTVDEGRREEARLAKLPALYKLHGSVTWNIEKNDDVRELEWAPGNLSAAMNLAIATPGDSKMKMAGGVFGRLWKEAAKALREADEVYIIGFRFPESDAFPRDRLLAALRENDKKELAVHVVLGPEQNADVRRVLALLRWTVGALPLFDDDQERYGGQRLLIGHSMWAEDFLSVWAGKEVRRSGKPMPWVDGD